MKPAAARTSALRIAEVPPSDSRGLSESMRILVLNSVAVWVCVDGVGVKNTDGDDDRVEDVE